VTTAELVEIATVETATENIKQPTEWQENISVTLLALTTLNTYSHAATVGSVAQ